MSARSGDYVDRNNMTSTTFDFSHNETGNAAASRVSIVRRMVRRIAGRSVGLRGIYSHQRKCCTTPEVKLEFRPRIGNSRWKAFLIDSPQRLEVSGLEVPYLEVFLGKVPGRKRHIAIVSAAATRGGAELSAHPLRAAQTPILLFSG